MILDRLDNAERYLALHPGFAVAFEYLRSTDPASLEAGRHEVAGEGVYAIVVDADGKGRAGTKLETHRKCIDIQFCVAGCDCIGWRSAADCAGKGAGYDESKDCELFASPPEVWVETPPGVFAIFFPEDAHAPMGATGPLHKVVVKVAV